MFRFQRFRPLTGTAFLKCKLEHPSIIIQTMFPSPHGDCISQMHIKWQEKRSEAASFRPLTGTAFLKYLKLPDVHYRLFDLFPSPHGDCISQIDRKVHTVCDLLIVSVPSRGLHFSNKLYYAEHEKYSVSVPLRGLHFSNQIMKTIFIFLCIVSVPLRGLHFSNSDSLNIREFRLIVSVPLRGLHFSNS